MHVVCHMFTSLDGRLLPDRWSPFFDKASAITTLYGNRP